MLNELVMDLEVIPQQTFGYSPPVCHDMQQQQHPSSVPVANQVVEESMFSTKPLNKSFDASQRTPPQRRALLANQLPEHGMMCTKPIDASRRFAASLPQMLMAAGDASTRAAPSRATPSGDASQRSLPARTANACQLPATVVPAQTGSMVVVGTPPVTSSASSTSSTSVHETPQRSPAGSELAMSSPGTAVQAWLAGVSGHTVEIASFTADELLERLKAAAPEVYED